MDQDQANRDELLDEALEVLLVEDNEDHAEMARHALTQDTEWSVHLVTTVEEACQALEEAGYDLVVVDYELPDGDGLEVLDYLREARRSDPVVFLTGQGSEDVAMEAIERGALDYLVKGPGLLDRLERRAVEALQDWRAIGPILETQAPGAPAEDTDVDIQGLLEELDVLVEGPVTGAIVRIPNGDTVGTGLPKGIDEAEVGDVMGRLHDGLGELRRFDGLSPRRWATVVQTSDHLLAISVAPGPLLIGLLLRPSTGSMIALRRAQESARRLWEAG